MGGAQMQQVCGCWLEVPFTITLRGTETRHIHDDRLGKKLLQAIKQAAQVFSVSESLRRLVISHGATAERIEVVGNGIDTVRFRALDSEQPPLHHGPCAKCPSPGFGRRPGAEGKVSIASLKFCLS